MLQIGHAHLTINNDLGRPVQGASVANVAESILDDLEANALYLGDGDTAVLLVSCDLAVLDSAFTRRACQAMSARCGVSAGDILIGCTHTHNGPVVLWTNRDKPVDEAYLDRLEARLCELAEHAVQSAQPGRVGFGSGWAKIGYNRRVCWADGSHSMHGDTTREDYTGLEGPDDPRHIALFTCDSDGRVTGILHNNASHPTCGYGQPYYSADFPGAARKHLRDVLGDIPVLYFNGAFGDLAIEDQTTRAPVREDRDRKVQRAAHLLAGETLRLMHECAVLDDPTLAHACAEMTSPVRMPAPDRLDWARTTLARRDAGEAVTPAEVMFAHGITHLHDSFADRPEETFTLHVLRIGGLGMVSVPGELFCQLGLDIKRRSPFAATAILGATDGYIGYLPTTFAALGGGYSGEALHWTRIPHETCHHLVDQAARLLHGLDALK